MNNKIRNIESLNKSFTGDSFELTLKEEDKYFTKLKSLFSSNSQSEHNRLKAKPTLRSGQLWIVKSDYVDYFANETHSNIPFIVVVIDANASLENELFSRVHPISPFIEFTSKDDYIINDSTLIGFPFLVETWNEQPLLNEMLDYYLGSIEIDQYASTSDSIFLSEDQIGFRQLEVENTHYLRNSISSYLKFLEERQTEDTGVVININQRIVKPDFYIDEIRCDTKYAQAAKTGIDNSNKYFEFIDKLDFKDIKIRIKRNLDDFTISVYSDEAIVLKNIDNKMQIGSKAESRIIYTGVMPGLYYLENSITKSLIKIRVK